MVILVFRSSGGEEEDAEIVEDVEEDGEVMAYETFSLPGTWSNAFK